MSELPEILQAIWAAFLDFVDGQDARISSAFSAGDLLQAELLLIGAVFIIPPLVAEGQLRASDMLLYYRPALPLVAATLITPWSVSGAFVLSGGSLVWMALVLGIQLFEWQEREAKAVGFLKGVAASPSLGYLQLAAREIMKAPKGGRAESVPLKVEEPKSQGVKVEDLTATRERLSLVRQQLTKARQELGRSTRKVGTAERKLSDMEEAGERPETISTAKQEIKDMEQVVREKQEALASLQRMEETIEHELWSLEALLPLSPKNDDSRREESP